MIWRRRDNRGDAPTGEGSAGALALVPSLDLRRDSLVLSLADELNDIDSGVGFIYRALERTAAHCKANDALLVLDDDTLGRQGFRLGRAPIEGSWAHEVVRNGEAGLYVTPSVLDPVIADGVSNMCAVALQLDVARHASLHDPLTGLLNRRGFDEALEASAARAARYEWPFALVLIDVDSFDSIVNDYGEAAGNRLLRSVGRELRGRLRAGDAAARVGDHEFALILPGANDSATPEIVSRLRRAAEETRISRDFSFSAGTATAPTDSTGAAALERIADARRYNGRHP